MEKIVIKDDYGNITGNIYAIDALQRIRYLEAVGVYEGGRLVAILPPTKEGRERIFSRKKAELQSRNKS